MVHWNSGCGARSNPLFTPIRMSVIFAPSVARKAESIRPRLTSVLFAKIGVDKPASRGPPVEPSVNSKNAKKIKKVFPRKYVKPR